MSIKAVNANSILARVYIKHKQGARIAYIMDRSIISELGVEYDKGSGLEEIYLSVGVVITLGDHEGNPRRYKIVDVRTQFMKDTWDDFRFGVNVYGIGEELPYNCTITYIVENAD